MSDKEHEAPTGDDAPAPDQGAGDAVEVEVELDQVFSERTDTFNMVVVGFTPVDPADAPDLGGLPSPAEPQSGTEGPSPDGSESPEVTPGDSE